MQNQSVKKRKTLSHEKEVLERLLIYKTKIPDQVYQEIEQLLGVEWNKKKIYSWWNYHIKKSD
ncbi:2967_t:CDS:2 [Funneliformis mosseae]|uniref:2967_t:CDS:1 n=1 Tax=Funneliformis mosseae TaxID=27381 RepID=A0A9N9ALM1_FUNMO|nr:2967_t:CDS:2 [Funneliformis mosseae]